MLDCCIFDPADVKVEGSKAEIEYDTKRTEMGRTITGGVVSGRWARTIRMR